MKTAITNRTTFVPVFLALIIIAIILLIRVMNGLALAPGDEPYLSSRLIRTFQIKGIITNDHLLIGGMPILFTPYNALGVLFSMAAEPITSMILASLTLAIITLIAIRNLLIRLGRPPSEILIGLTILSTSPPFIHDALITGNRIGSLALISLSMYLLSHQRRVHKIAGLCSTLLASTFSPIIALTCITANLIIMIYQKNSWRWISAMVASAIIGVAMIPAGFTIEFPGTYGPSQALADLGGLGGMPTFTLLLSTIGMWLLWPRKAAVAAIIAVSIGSFFSSALLSPANLALCILSGTAIHYLIMRNWHIKDLKRLSILVITCGLLFSTISSASRISRVGPSESLKESLTWLLGHSRSGEVVLSSPENGHYIQYFATRPVILDRRIQKNESRKTKADEIFATFNINSATTYFAAMNVSFIYVTPEMTSGTTWQSPQTGLHYLLTDDETFKKIYQNEGIEIYEYLKKPLPRIRT